MFPFESLSEFYSDGSNEDPNWTISEEIQGHYFSYIYDFCTLVSTHWKKYLKRLTQRNAATFSKQLTTSDEAFTQWYIMVTYDEVQEQVNQIKDGKDVEQQNSDTEAQKKGKNSGEHLIRKHGEQYVSLYQSQVTLRTTEIHLYKRWEGAFFDKFFYHAQNNSPKSNKRKRLTNENDPFESIEYRTDFD